MGKCAAYGCNNNVANGRGTKGPKGITYYLFPIDPKIRRAWIKITGRQNWEPSDLSTLCSAHFEEHCFDWKSPYEILKPDAIPTIFAGSQRYTISQSPESEAQIGSVTQPKNSFASVEASGYTRSLDRDGTSLLEVNRKRLANSSEANDVQLSLLYKNNKESLTVPKNQQDCCGTLPDVNNELLLSTGKSDQLASLSEERINELTESAARCSVPWKEIISNRERRLYPNYYEDLSSTRTMVLKKKLDEITRENIKSKRDIRTLQQSHRRLCQRKKKIETIIENTEKKNPVCSARNCNSINSNAEFSFYRFPIHNPELLEKWLKVCKQDWTPTRWSTLCSKHFTPECFETSMETKILADDAFPSIASEDPSSDQRSKEETAVRVFCRGICEDWENEETKKNSDEESKGKPDEETKKICRLCTVKGTTHVPIFEECDGVDRAVAEKISRCLPIIVLPTDGLPLAVCLKCLHFLNMSYRLLVKSVRADALLRSRLKNSRQSPISISNRSATRSEKEEVGRRVESSSLIASLDENPIECDICRETFDSADHLYSHVEAAHLLEWRCSLCAESFESSAHLLEHKELRHKGEIVACKNCCACPRSPAESPGAEYISDVNEMDRERTVAKGPIVPDDQIAIYEEVTVAYKQIELSHDLTRNTCEPETGREKNIMCGESPMVNSSRSCDLCGIIFATERQLNYHKKRTCPKVSGLQCKYCNESFRSKNRLVTHLRKHKKEMLEDPTVTVYQCVTCPKKFVDKGLYQKHRNVHDPECWDRFRCSVCARSFTDASKLRLHQGTHQGLKPFSCDVCDRRFNRCSNMRKHRVRHFNQKCPYCEAIFEAQRPLTKHLKECHSERRSYNSNSKIKTDRFVCKFCGKQLASYSSLLAHERIHTGDKPFACKQCGKKFRSYTGRWHHALRHKKGKYVCEHCGKTYNSEPNLNRHLQIHVPVAERKYQCSYCGKRFYWKRHLNVHVRVHTGLRPFVCDICQFGFAQHSDLKRHRARHFDAENRVRVRHPQGQVTPEAGVADSAESGDENINVNKKNEFIGSQDDITGIVTDAIECVYYEEVE